MTSELRIKIAESLGWTKVEWYEDNQGPPILHGFPPPEVALGKDGDWDLKKSERSKHVPNWFFDANAALQLVEVLKREGWSAHLDNMNDSLWECDFMRNREFYSASATALPEAICLAYCAVKSIQTNE